MLEVSYQFHMPLSLPGKAKSILPRRKNTGPVLVVHVRSRLIYFILPTALT